MKRLQLGISLVEAMIAFVIMGAGMLAMIGMESALGFNSDVSRQRSEAVRLAEEAMERLRTFARLSDANDDLSSFDGFTNGTTVKGVGSGNLSNTAFTIATSLRDQGHHREAKIQVEWTDRFGHSGEANDRFVALHSVIARLDPALSGRLTVPPPGAAQVQPLGRHVSIPPDARDFGNGRSGYVPPGRNVTTAWVFDNQSGLVIRVCNVQVAIGNVTLTEALLRSSTCADLPGSSRIGYVVRGTVRLATGDRASPAVAQAPADATLDLDMTMSLSSVGEWQCFDDSSTAQRQSAVEYVCLVQMARDASGWSGRLSVSPAGWNFGGTAEAYRLCRYSADYDGNGTIANPEHPATYAAVRTNLAYQNFLLVRGDRSCPADTTAQASIGVNGNTVQHEPQR